MDTFNKRTTNTGILSRRFYRGGDGNRHGTPCYSSSGCAPCFRSWRPRFPIGDRYAHSDRLDFVNSPLGDVNISIGVHPKYQRRMTGRTSNFRRQYPCIAMRISCIWRDGARRTSGGSIPNLRLKRLTSASSWRNFTMRKKHTCRPVILRYQDEALFVSKDA